MITLNRIKIIKIVMEDKNDDKKNDINRLKKK